MRMAPDRMLLMLSAVVVSLLLVASAIGWTAGRLVAGESSRVLWDNVNARIRAWWVMALVFIASASTGASGSILLFAMVSFLALREFVTLAPTRAADHRALAWCFFIVTPLEYTLIWMGWYGLFSILIPVYVSIFAASRAAIAGDSERFMERTAVIQWGLLICVYFVGYVPALLVLRIPGFEQRNAALVFFLVLVVQISDVLQYVCGKSLGKRRIAPAISPNKTWAGCIGGIASATAIGAAVWWATPFSPIQAALMAFVSALMGFAGGLIMSAIKRGRGVKDYGSLIQGHGGMLDRIDSLCFAAPVFFHLTRFFFTP